MNSRKTRRDYRTMKKGYYHLASDGWKEGKIFNNIVQYAYGMVLMGLVALKYDIVIYDFSLMPNHFHIILSGTGEQALDSFGYLKRKMNLRLTADGYPSLPDDYGFKLTPITTEEQMRDCILYLARNHYEAMLAVPGAYPWCSSYLHFSPLSQFIVGEKAKDMSARELERWTGARGLKVPDYWEFHPVLGLLPKSFVCHEQIRKRFRSPKDYTTHLVKNYESFSRIAQEIGEEVSFDRYEIKDIVFTILNNSFNGRHLSKLDGTEKGRVAVIMSRQYNLSPEAIAEALGISAKLVGQFLRAKDFK